MKPEPDHVRDISDQMDLEPVFVGIFGPAMATNALVELARTALRNAGYQSGEWTLEQEMRPGEVCGNLDLPPALVRRAMRRGFELKLGDITLVAEAP